MKKRVVILILMIGVMLVFLPGCSGAGGSGGKGDLQLEYGYTVNPDLEVGSSMGIVVTNHGDKAATGVQVTVYAYDVDDKLMVYDEDDPATEAGAFGTVSDFYDLGTILPGESAAFAGYGYEGTLSEMPDHVKAEVTSVKWKDPAEVGPRVTLVDDDYTRGAEVVHATIRNDTEVEFSMWDPQLSHVLTYVIIARDADGKVVGGQNYTIERFPPNTEDTVTIPLWDDPFAGLPVESVETYLHRLDQDADGVQKITYYDEEGNEISEEEFMELNEEMLQE
ncbi:MAG: hypothetical protein IJH75_04120 [Mogibacterium sp.]|nr:hypothetical protein [Mogibacterium sp.]